MSEPRDIKLKIMKKQRDAKLPEGTSSEAQRSAQPHIEDQLSRIQGKVKAGLVLLFAGILMTGGIYTLVQGVNHPPIILASLITIVLGVVIVLFGILPSAASNDGEKTSYKGPIAGFIGIITLLIAAFSSGGILSPNNKIYGQIKLDNVLVNDASVQLIGALSVGVKYVINSNQPGYFEFANTQSLSGIALTLRIKLPTYDDYDYELPSADRQSLKINIESAKLKARASGHSGESIGVDSEDKQQPQAKIDFAQYENKMIFTGQEPLGKQENRTYYLIKDGKRHRVVSLTLIKYLYARKADQATPMSEKIVSQIPIGEKITWQDGMLLKHYYCPNGPCQRYMVINRFLRPITSSLIAESYGCILGRAVEFKKEDVDGGPDSLKDVIASLKMKSEESGELKNIRCLEINEDE